MKQDSSPGATILDSKSEDELNKVERIRLDTIDNYISRTALIPSLLKIDVEGNELLVLKGGERCIKSNKPKILVEIEARHVGLDKAKETFSHLINIGYQGFFIHGRNFIELDKFSFDKYQNTNDMGNYCNNFIFE